MSLPTPTQLMTMDYSFGGEPFVDVPAGAGTNLKSMDYAFEAQPFVSNPDALNGSSFFLFYSPS